MKPGHKQFPKDPNPNSAALFIDVQAKARECGDTMLAGVTDASVKTSFELMVLAESLHARVIEEREAAIKRESERVAASQC